MTPFGIEPMTFVARHLNHFATAVPSCHGTMHYFVLVSRAEVTIEFFYPSLRLQHPFPQHILLRTTQNLKISPGTPYFFMDIIRLLFRTYFAGLISVCGISHQDGQYTHKSNTESRSRKKCCCGKQVLNIMRICL